MCYALTLGVLGARFSGAGFRGCCLALVRPGEAAAAAEDIKRRYSAAHPELAGGAAVVITRSAAGARLVDVDQGED